MKLKKPAQVGNTVFGVGVSDRLVVERAQREYEYQKRPKPTKARLAKLRKFIRTVGGRADV